MPLSIFKRLLICFCFALLTALPAQAEEQKNGTLPPALETALSTLLADAPQGKADPDAATVNAVLDFVATNKQAANKVRPEARPQGSGAYLKETLNVPLRKLVEYMLDPSIPGEAIYPSAVRRNAWMPGSPILKDNAALTDAAYPPAAPIVTRGVEYEETTPDTSSGCYYSYKLNRLFVLADYKGRTALISVSVMPGQSSVGLRGAIVGNDKDWTYVYTPEKGTNLAMLGWAETYLYGSASISVFMESAPGSGKVRRGVDPAGLGAQRPPQRPTRPAQQPPEPPPRRRTAERPAAQLQPVHRAAPRPQQRSSYHAQQPNRGSAPHPRLCCKPRLPDRRVILAGTAAGILLLAGVITLLLPSNKAVENVPVGTEQTAQAGRLVAPVPYADSDGSDNGGPSIDWGTIGPVQQAETYTYTAAPQAPDMVPEFGRVSTDWFSDAAFLGDSLTAGIAYYDINVGGALVLGYEGTSPNQIVNRTALKNTNEDDAEQVPLDILAEQQPAKLYLLIGTNALAGLGNDEGFLAYYGKLLDELQSTLPNSMIFVQSILNVRPEALDQAPGLTPERVGSMNDKIKEMCKERGFYYLNLTEAFTGEDGYLTADYAQNDGIHLTVAGYSHWVDYLCTHVPYNKNNSYQQGSTYYLSDELRQLIADLP